MTPFFKFQGWGGTSVPLPPLLRALMGQHRTVNYVRDFRAVTRVVIINVMMTSIGKVKIQTITQSDFNFFNYEM